MTATQTGRQIETWFPCGKFMSVCRRFCLFIMFARPHACVRCVRVCQKPQLKSHMKGEHKLKSVRWQWMSCAHNRNCGHAWITFYLLLKCVNNERYRFDRHTLRIGGNDGLGTWKQTDWLHRIGTSFSTHRKLIRITIGAHGQWAFCHISSQYGCRWHIFIESLRGHTTPNIVWCDNYYQR